MNHLMVERPAEPSAAEASGGYDTAPSREADVTLDTPKGRS